MFFAAAQSNSPSRRWKQHGSIHLLRVAHEIHLEVMHTSYFPPGEEGFLNVSPIVRGQAVSCQL